MGGERDPGVDGHVCPVPETIPLPSYVHEADATWKCPECGQRWLMVLKDGTVSVAREEPVSERGAS